MSLISDSLEAVGNRVIEQVAHDDNSDMVKIVIGMCIVFMGFVIWLAMILIKNGLNQRQVGNSINDSKSSCVCSNHNGLMDLMVSMNNNT